jgi:hypothetical protein
VEGEKLKLRRKKQISLSLSLLSLSYPGQHADRLRPGLARQAQEPIDDPRDGLLLLGREELSRVEGHGGRRVEVGEPRRGRRGGSGVGGRGRG